MTDKRITPARPDLAASWLKGQVDALEYVEGEAATIIATCTALRAEPSDDAAQDSELLFGETVAVYEREDGWAWVQADNDRYVGYVHEDALDDIPEADAHIIVPSAPVLTRPELKAPLQGLLPMGALVTRGMVMGDYVEIGPDSFVYHRHLAPLEEAQPDFVAVAEQFLNAPYVWGGKTASGIDCSGLIQVALQAAGMDCPRDTDMQEKALGDVILAATQRGDLVFWKGHVGVMLDGERLLHANAWHMMVAVEPLAEAVARIEKIAGPILSVRRL
jgi:cell wall-associated NlpC family hydrolase